MPDLPPATLGTRAAIPSGELMRILILAPYPPYPPHGGGTMRIYQLIRGLAAHHQVTCLTFVPDINANQAFAPLRAICTVHTVLGPPARPILKRAWTTLASALPDMALRNASQEYSAALSALLASGSFDIVQAESIEMVGYLFGITGLQNDPTASQSLLTSPERRHPLLVFDTFNIEYMLQKRAALTSLHAALHVGTPQAFVRNLAGGFYSLVQWAKLVAYERRVLRRCDAIAAVSDGDAQALQKLAPSACIAVVPNGVDTTEFQRNSVTANARIIHPGPQLVFSGTLDFRPNIDAVLWFAYHVLPLVRIQIPAVRFVVVGRKPAAAITTLANAGLITLTGEVPDARPYLRDAAAYVVPMRIGGGVRLKLLEALSLEAAVVSTSMGAEGIIGLRNAEHCLLADTPVAFADAIVRILRDPAYGQRLGSAGRQLVAASYDWEYIVPKLEALYEQAKLPDTSP